MNLSEGQFLCISSVIHTCNVTDTRPANVGYFAGQSIVVQWHMPAAELGVKGMFFTGKMSKNHINWRTSADGKELAQ